MSYLERLPGAMQEKELPVWRESPGVRLLAAFAQGDDGDAAAGFQRGHRIRPGPARPQAHHHHADLR